MDNKSFERLNELSEKVMCQGANQLELKEFEELLLHWNLSIEQNLIQRVNKQTIDLLMKTNNPL